MTDGLWGARGRLHIVGASGSIDRFDGNQSSSMPACSSVAAAAPERARVPPLFPDPNAAASLSSLAAPWMKPPRLINDRIGPDESPNPRRPAKRQGEKGAASPAACRPSSPPPSPPLSAALLDESKTGASEKEEREEEGRGAAAGLDGSGPPRPTTPTQSAASIDRSSNKNRGHGLGLVSLSI
jgi:hypothetical protein